MSKQIYSNLNVLIFGSFSLHSTKLGTEKMKERVKLYMHDLLPKCNVFKYLQKTCETIFVKQTHPLLEYTNMKMEL